ncbi:Flp pilus assembly protein CpaB [Sphingosinicellaceae bacterium]|nr:Flp pilus assembly protein CpaB [Sphingosinicellaceae bacterium]
MLIGAAVLGVIAVFIARVALSPSAPQQAVVQETSSVAAATIAMSFGDKLTAANLKLVKLPAEAIPQGAFRTIPAALGDGTRVAQRAIAANEVIVPSAISGTGNRLSASGAIGPAMRAISVTLTEATGVGGLIAPGDHVDVYITRTPPEKAPHFDVVAPGGSVSTDASGAAGLGAAAGHVINSASNAVTANSIGIDGKPIARRGPQATLVRAATAGEDTKLPPITDLLVQDVRVLAIGQNSNVSTEKPELVKSATLEVTPVQVSKLTLGQSVGVLTLVLRPLSDKDRNAISSMHVEDLHDGPATAVAVSSPRRGGRAVKHAAAPSVTIVRGVASTSYAVPGGQ